MLAELLTCEGAAVSIAEGGDAAFEVFTRERPDVLVSDLSMPSGNGYELVQRIRALPDAEGKLTPAIALSASENARRATLAGFHAFVAKPTVIDDLVTIVAEFKRRPGEQCAQAPWTVYATGHGCVVSVFVGNVTGADMRRYEQTLRVHLQNGPCEIIHDLRKEKSTEALVASMRAHAAGPYSNNVRNLRCVGGTALARSVTAAECTLLGIVCTFCDALEDPTT